METLIEEEWFHNDAAERVDEEKENEEKLHWREKRGWRELGEGRREAGEFIEGKVEVVDELK